MSVMHSPLTFDAASQLYVVTLVRPIRGVILQPPHQSIRCLPIGQTFKTFLRTGRWSRRGVTLEIKSLHDLSPEKQEDGAFNQIIEKLSQNASGLFKTRNAALRQMNIWQEKAGKRPDTLVFDVARLTDALPCFAARLSEKQIRKDPVS